MSESYNIYINIIGKDKASKAATSTKVGLEQLAKVARGAAGMAMVHYATQAAKATAQVVKLGASSLATRDMLVAFAGGTRQAAEATEALNRGSLNTLDNLQATEMALALLRGGLATNTHEFEMAGAAISRLGVKSKSTEQLMQSLALMLANESTRRLDDFGMSIDAVTTKQRELEGQGYTTQKAFAAAFWSEVETQLGVVGGASDNLSTDIAELEGAWRSLTQAGAENLAQQVEFMDLLPGISKVLNEQAKFVRSYTDAQAIAVEVLKRTNAEMTGVQLEKMVQDIVSAGNAIKEFAPEMERFQRLMAGKEEAGATPGQAGKDWANVQVARRQYRLLADIVEGRKQDKREEAEAVAEAHARMAAAESNYLRTVQDIYQSLAQLDQDRIAQVQERTRQEQLALIDAAEQAELARLQDIISARQWQDTLADMARSHQERMAAIRARGQQTERQQENDRYRAILDNLDKEQKARMDALRRRYGKTVSGEDKRAEAEKEHLRRMMGLYTDSARKQEEKRYQQVLKELEFEEEEARLIEEFAKEKERAEKEHQAHLKEIHEQEIAEALAAEERRYRDQVASAEKRRAQQQSDEGERQAIVQRYDEQRQAIEAAGRAAMLEAEQISYARRKAALEQSLLDAETALQRATTAFGLAVQAARDMAWYGEDAFRRLKLAAKDFIGGEHPPPRLQHGTEAFRGGVALVGEREPEFLNLPTGTRVTPWSQVNRGAGGGINITNYYGPGSIRSDRDIRRMAEEQERALRLRGLGVVN